MNRRAFALLCGTVMLLAGLLIAIPPQVAQASLTAGTIQPEAPSLLHQVQRRGGWGGGFRSWPSAPRRPPPVMRPYSPPSRTYSNPPPPTQQRVPRPQTGQGGLQRPRPQQPRMAGPIFTPSRPRIGGDLALRRPVGPRPSSLATQQARRTETFRQASALRQRNRQLQQVASSLRTRLAATSRQLASAQQARRIAIAASLSARTAASNARPAVANSLHERSGAGCATGVGGLTPSDTPTYADRFPPGSYQVAALGPHITLDAAADTISDTFQKDEESQIASLACEKFSSEFNSRARATGLVSTIKSTMRLPNQGFYLNNLARPSEQLRKGIRSLQARIDEHREKIANPTSSIPEFNELDPRIREYLLNIKWPSDIKRQQAQKTIL